MFNSLEAVMLKYGLEFSSFLSFASDTCSVIKGARSGVITKLLENQPRMIGIYCVWQCSQSPQLLNLLSKSIQIR